MEMTLKPTVEFKLFCLFGAIGAGAKGFMQAKAHVGNLKGVFRCIGSVDVDVAANRDFKRFVGSEATTMDLFSRDQYIDFHGKEPPADWREATPEDIRRAAGYEAPNAVFTSSPCKGFSGLLSSSKSQTAKYQALNKLTLRGIWLMLEAWKDNLPELVLFENVPRVASRGRALLDQICSLLRHYGYAVAETVHDCGELGGLAQSRRRFLLVARHIEKVPPFLYEPAKKPLLPVGDVLGKLPLPGDGHPMHRVPSLQFATWTRLAMVEAGKDWRSLNRLNVKDGFLTDYRLVALQPGEVMGIDAAQAPGFALGDPRFQASARWHDGQAYGVRRWDESTGTVAGQQGPGQGVYSVADPRCPSTKHNNCFKVVRYDQPAGTVTGGGHPSAGGLALADPRSGMGQHRPHYQTGGHYGVVSWDQACGAVSSAACHDNGRWSVADPRVLELPKARDHLVAVIISEDGTWHRPFTTLELAALQSLFDPEDPDDMAAFMLDGSSDSAHRERIGNAVPPKAAKAIGNEMLRTLLLAKTGETFMLSNAPVWVRPFAAAIQVAQPA